MKPQYLFIVNPLSGAGKGELVAELLKRLLPKHSVFGNGKGEVYLTNELDTPALIEKLARAKAVIAVGGDGTASSLIPHILSSEASPALGLIPLGTSNDLARSLGIPVNVDYATEPGLKRVLECLAKPEEWRLDVHCINGDWFFSNYFSVGFDAAIVRDFHRIRCLKWTRLIPQGRLTNNLLYFLLGLKNLGHHLEPVVTVDFEDGDGSHHVAIDSRCRALIITNLPIYAGGCRIYPDARMDDGMFEITVVRSVWQYIRLILSRFIPFITVSSALEQYRARGATINLIASSPCQKDGEPCSSPARGASVFEIRYHSSFRILVASVPPTLSTEPA